MATLIFDQSKITDRERFLQICPFGALSFDGDAVSVAASCKMCKLCVKAGYATLQEAQTASVDKSAYRGICVYVDHDDGVIHPVTYELIGKARELAAKVGYRVSALFMGADITEAAQELLHYGVDRVFVYDHAALRHYVTESYTAVFSDYIDREKPSVILVGATSIGRQLAPRVAARHKTGLTADCTVLDMTPDTDLVQIRPAFGGNIMAEIRTPHNRPQIATVRYKVMNAPAREAEARGEIVSCSIAEEKLASRVKVLQVSPKPKAKGIEQAEVLVVCGRGVKSREDVALLTRLAELLGGQVAFSRPMVEAGYGDAKNQIGLSGRTVRPKLIITCGVSGAVQFTAGMSNAEYIVAINRDESAPIFQIAHCGIVGDLYEILPALIKKLEATV